MHGASFASPTAHGDATPAPRASILIAAPDGTVADNSTPNPAPGAAPSTPAPTPTPTPYRVPPNLDKVPVSRIDLDFRPVSSSEDPQSIVHGTSQHAFIVVTRANGFKQVLAAEPVGTMDKTFKNASQTTFQGGSESQANVSHPTRSFQLHAPSEAGKTPAQSLTDYGNSSLPVPKRITSIRSATTSWQVRVGTAIVGPGRSSLPRVELRVRPT